MKLAFVLYPRFVQVHREPMGNKRFDSLGDYFHHKYRLRIECRGCNRVVVQEPLAMLELCRKRGWGH